MRILKTLYCSLILPHLNYCLLTWGPNAGKILRLQKKAIGVICGSKYNAHTEPLFKKLHLLKINDMYKLKMLIFFYNYQNGNLPTHLQLFDIQTGQEVHNYRTRNSHQIRITPTNTKFADKHIRVAITNVVNGTPDNIITKIHTHSLQGYKRYTKNMIINEYSSECNIPNCYVCPS